MMLLMIALPLLRSKLMNSLFFARPQSSQNLSTIQIRTMYQPDTQDRGRSLLLGSSSLGKVSERIAALELGILDNAFALLSVPNS
jgi:hypothetical protein